MIPFFNILKKIIRTGVGRSRLLMATVGLGVAMLLLLLAIQAHRDFEQLLYGKKNRNESADFLVINKKITNDMMGQTGKSAFTPQEIEKIKQQPFVEGFGFITSNQFKVTAAAPGELQFYTDMFFESVPDSFIDVRNEDWKWQEGDRELPIILPNDFLNLYNFGFALSQNLPQVSQESVMSLPVKITISRGLLSESFTGRIVGFSDRISSFLVPASFMQWANRRFGSGTEAAPSRVVIKTSDPSDPGLAKFLDDNGFTTSQDKLRYSKTRLVVQTIVSVIGFFGLVLLLFALLVFSMFVQLVTAACRKEIQLLVTLGTAPAQLRRYLMKQLSPLYLVSGLAALALVGVLQWWASRALAAHQLYVSPWPAAATLIAAVVVLLLVFMVNRRSISRSI
jgi:hypothetical protein